MIAIINRIRSLDKWINLAFIFLFLQIALCLILRLRLGHINIYLWIFGPTTISLLTLPLFLLGLRSIIKTRNINWHSFIGMITLFVILSFSYFGYRIYPSSHDDKVSDVLFRLPFNEPINVAWGGSEPENNYHVSFPDQKWAYDLIIRKNGLRYRGNGENLEDYFVFDTKIFSPAKGKVIFVKNDEPDKPIGVKFGGGNPAGNYIVIEVAKNEYLFLGHLKQGSVRVNSGDYVETGQEIARAGNSGRTPVPHLHIHLQDTPTIGVGEGIPLYFYNYKIDGEVIEKGIPNGGNSKKFIENVSNQVRHSNN